MIPFKKFVVLDTETTGTDKNIHEPVQIAGVFKIPKTTHKMHNKSFNIFSRPINEESVDPAALEVIGKTHCEILEYPNPYIARGKFQELCFSVVNRFDKNDKMFIVGYNVQFDSDMLRSWFLKTGDQYFGSLFSPYVIDILPIIKNMFAAGRFNGIDNLQLSSVFQYLFPKENIDAHDAMGDVNATISVYNYIRKFSPSLLPELG